jgi:hypothetical protein
MTTIKIKKGAGTPSGLTFGELAYDITNRKLFIGITGGNALLANTDGGVASFNGLTGAVTGVTLGGAAFTGLVSSTVGFSGSGTNLSGSATGLTAGTATNVIITDNNGVAAQYLTFVTGTGGTGLRIDKTTTPLTYVPATSTLKIGTDPTSLSFSPTVIQSGGIFSFAALGGMYFDESTLLSFGDIAQAQSKMLFDISPTTATKYARLYIPDYASNATLLVNRFTPVGTHAFEVNRSDGKAAKLIYGDTGGTASNYVDLDVSSTGNLTITPSGGTASISGNLTVTGTLTGVTANFTGRVSSTVGFSGPGTNITGLVSSFNGLTGAVSGVTVGGTNVFTALNSFSVGISAAGATFSAPISSTRMARHTSAAISAQKTVDFTPTAAEDGTVFYINYTGKGSVTVTLDGLPIGWRAKFLNVGTGSVFFETTGDAYGYGATNGLGEFMLEAICIGSNTYFVG